MNPWTIYGPCPTYWTMDETICAVAKIFSSLPFGVPKQQISPILIDLVLCGLPSMENSEYLSLQIEKIRVEHQPPTITLKSASSSSFGMGTGRRPWSLSSLFWVHLFLLKKKVFRWMWSSFLRCSTYNKGFQKKDWFARHKRFFYPLFFGRAVGRTSILRPTLSCNVKQPEQRELEDWDQGWLSRRLGGLCVLVDV